MQQYPLIDSILIIFHAYGAEMKYSRYLIE